MHKFYITCGVLFTTFIWEYLLIEVNTIWRPSVPLSSISNLLIDMFTVIGKVLAWISSFYTYIEWSRLYRTLHVLCTPIFNIVFSWLYILSGYYDYVYSLSLNILSVEFGSLTLLTLCVSSLWYFGIINVTFDYFKMDRYDSELTYLIVCVSMIVIIIASIFAIDANCEY